VAVDLPGHGQSGRSPRPYGLADFAADLAYLCYELGVYRPVAIGHGAGGMIAIELAARSPRLLGAVVTLDAPLLSAARTGPQGVVARGAAWSDCSIPVLHIRVEGSCAGIARLPKPSRHMARETVRVADLPPRAKENQVNKAIDAFLISLAMN
jgi:pimeloyl-ACP methyl ester carboxylesterase